MHFPSKILWAVDAFTEDKSLHGKTARILRAWMKGLDTDIEPVFVLSPAQLYMPPDIFGGMVEDIRATAKERLKKILAGTKVPRLLPPTILVADTMSLRSAVFSLIGYARQTGAGMIAVSTQSRKGATRFFFGSFAETLVLQSNVPILTVSPKARPVQRFKQVLYCTELDGKGGDAFEGVMRLAAEHKARLTIFNKVEYLTEHTADTISASPVYADYLKSDLDRRRKAIEVLAGEARARGISVDVVIDTKATSVTQAILTAARRSDADLLALTSQTGPVTTALLGSTSRQILRSAQCPVWMTHAAVPAAARAVPSTSLPEGRKPIAKST